jgi:hypothetical protein
MITLTAQHLKLIKERLDEDGIEYSIQTNYSGRGMYGAICFAIVTSNPLWTLALSLFVRNRTSLEDQVSTLAEYFEEAPKQDNMGRDSMVYYWPSIKVEEEEIEEGIEVLDSNVEA